MLLMDFPCIEDQLVPEFLPNNNFAGLQSQQSLPDFDVLMSDLSSTFSLPNEFQENFSCNTPTLCAPSLSPVHSMDLSNSTFPVNEEITFYDEGIHIKQEPVDLYSPVKQQEYLYNPQAIKTENQHTQVEHSLGFEQEYQTLNQNQLEESIGSISEGNPLLSDTPAQDAMSEVKKQMENVCGQLNIPQDPHVWDVDQAQRWVQYTLSNYKLPVNYAHLFRMDGTHLCMMDKATFKAKSLDAGPYIYEELQIWKDTYCYTSSPSHEFQEDSQTYVDLEPVHQQHSFLPQQAMPPHYSTITSRPSIEIQIPRPVLNASPSSSPAPSIDSMDSSSSSHHSFSACKLSPANSMDNLSHTSPKMAPLKGVTPGKHNIQLWQFLRELLMTPQHYGNCIRWLDRSKGIFKIEDSQRVARLWGQRKNRPAMNYDKLSRSVRQYYKKGIIKKTDNSKRLVYQFCQQYRI